MVNGFSPFFFFFGPGSCAAYVSQVVFEMTTTLLWQPPESWDNRRAPLSLAWWFCCPWLGIEYNYSFFLSLETAGNFDRSALSLGVLYSYFYQLLLFMPSIWNYIPELSPVNCASKTMYQVLQHIWSMIGRLERTQAWASILLSVVHKCKRRVQWGCYYQSLLHYAYF